MAPHTSDVYGDFLSKRKVWKGEECNFTVEKPDKEYLYQVMTDVMIICAFGMM